MSRDTPFLKIVTPGDKLTFTEVAQGLAVSREGAAAGVRHLVTKKLFTGYINWQEETVQSTEVDIHRTDCPNCAAPLATTPRGTKICAGCGTEVCGGSTLSDELLARLDAGDMEAPGIAGGRVFRSPKRQTVKCQECGADVDLAGHIRVSCPYCGCEVFLP